MSILDDNPVTSSAADVLGVYFGGDLLSKISGLIGVDALQRVVIDIKQGAFVRVYIVSAQSEEILRAIDLEDLIKGTPLTQLGLDKPE